MRTVNFAVGHHCRVTKKCPERSGRGGSALVPAVPTRVALVHSVGSLRVTPVRFLLIPT